MIDLSWLSETMNAFRAFFPRREIIRHTHAGVKWSFWRKPKSLRPGVMWYWPLISDVEIIPVARQPHASSIQSLTTFDGTEVAVAATVAYSINDIIKAIGHKNFDIDETIGERTRVAVASIVMGSKYEDLLAEDVEKELTCRCRKQLRPYGVTVSSASLTDFTTCRPLNLIGIPEPQQI